MEYFKMIVLEKGLAILRRLLDLVLLHEKVKYLSSSLVHKPLINLLNNCNKLRNSLRKLNSIQPRYSKHSAHSRSLPRIHLETFLCILSNLSDKYP